ncbi:MAG: DNA primase [Bacteroidales bacterium]
MITRDTIDKILDATRIDEVVGEFVNLKKRGTNLLGLCPFHDEKTPSFSVSVPKGIYKCFGCGKGGDAVSFLMEHEHYTYPEALKYLARKYGIEIEEERPSPEQQEAIDEKESLFNLSAFAQKFYQEQLHDTEEGKSVGLTYLKERGYTLDTMRKFGLGYALNRWDAFTQTALKSGYKKEYLEKTSLCKSKDHQMYDTFRGRIVFPIHNLSGRVLGFGARILGSEKNKPKYINSAESDIYHKSKVLYGLFFAKSAMAAQDNCYLVEGYTDVISMHQAGIENVIASSGTALSGDQVKLIRRYTSNITLLFDGDPAGIKAAFRGIDMILEEGLNVRIVLFPDGEDPDSFARTKRPVEVKAFIQDQANDFISFKTRLLLGETRNDPIKKAGLIREIARTISLIPEPIARTLYVQKCADLMKVEEKLLVTEVNKLRRNKFTGQTQPRQDEAPAAAPLSDRQQDFSDSNDWQEKEIIRILLNHGDKEINFEVENEDKHMETVSSKVMHYVVQDILDDKLDFENPQCKAIFEAFAGSLKTGFAPGKQTFLNHPDEKIKTLAIDLQTTPYTFSSNWEDRHRIYVSSEEEVLKTVVIEAVYSFKLKKLEKMIMANQKLMKDQAESGAPSQETLLKLMETDRSLKTIRSAFARALNRVVTK